MALAASDPKSEPISLVGSTMGTTYAVTYFPNEKTPSSDQVHKEIEDILRAVNESMSTYMPNSEISRFNRADAAKPMPITEPFATVTSFGLQLAKLTDGVFDPTIGPLLRLYQFGPDSAGKKKEPDREQLQAAKAVVDFRNVALTKKQGQFSLAKSKPGVELDLSAIAKGFGVDRLVSYLSSIHVDSLLVEIGGEIRALGRKPSGEPWRVAIEQPSGLSRKPLMTFALDGMAIATSGNYRNFRLIEGRRVGHIFDAKLGKYVASSVVSVSVIADQCMVADGWATALLAMGKQPAIKRANAEGLKAVFVVLENNHLGVVKSEAFKAFEKQFNTPSL